MRTNEEILTSMKGDLALSGLAPITQHQYFLKAQRFLNHCDRKCEEMNEQDIRDYITHLLNEQNLASSTVIGYRTAICFLFEVTLDRKLNQRKIPRVKKVRSFPEILTRDEISLIFEHEPNFRNRAIFITAYSAGLRLSEVCKLRVKDIDSENMRIFVNHGKRDKDRYTVLAQKNLVVLREYWKQYQTSLKKSSGGYLFLSGFSNRDCLCTSSVWKLFKAAVKRAGIKKDVSIHVLRTCFATHLLESGMDIYRIKQLLGHSSIQSTTYYIRLSKFDNTIKSPFDLMDITEVDDG